MRTFKIYTLVSNNVCGLSCNKSRFFFYYFAIYNFDHESRSFKSSIFEIKYIGSIFKRWRVTIGQSISKRSHFSCPFCILQIPSLKIVPFFNSLFQRKRQWIDPYTMVSNKWCGLRQNEVIFCAHFVFYKFRPRKSSHFLLIHFLNKRHSSHDGE